MCFEEKRGVLLLGIGGKKMNKSWNVRMGGTQEARL